MGLASHESPCRRRPYQNASLCISDVGMTGPHESILGRKIEKVLKATITFRPIPFDVATGNVQISGVVIDLDPKSGKGQGIRRIKINEKMAAQLEDQYED